MDELRVRVYNVRFGDAILVTVPEAVAGGGTEIRHILFDVGNALLKLEEIEPVKYSQRIVY